MASPQNGDDAATPPSSSSCINQDDLLLCPPLTSVTQICQKHDRAIRPFLCRIFIASQTLKIGMETRFTALTLIHRFYAAIMNAKNDMNAKNETDDGPPESEAINMGWAAAACIFLACKAEEEPRRLRDIINVTHMIFLPPNEMSVKTKKKLGEVPTLNGTNQSTVDATSSGGGGAAAEILTLQVNPEPPPLNEEYWAAKGTLVRMEQIVLRWLGFDVSVSKPHRMVAVLVQQPPVSEILLKGEIQPGELVSIAWRRINDSVFYAKALQHTALELATASIALSLKEPNQKISSETSVSCKWWTAFGVSDAALASAQEDLNYASASLR